jgi:hypothetical protein
MACPHQTGSLVRVEAIVTSLIFDHALRIRLKAETSEKKADDTASGASSPTAASDSGKGATTPDNASESGDGEDDETVHSRTATSTTTATATTSTTVTAVASPSPPPQNGRDDKSAKEPDAKNTAKAATEDTSKKGSNLVGKINNLVTSDLDNITSGRDFLFISECISSISPARY